MADGYLCRGCQKVVTGTKLGRYRAHTDGDGNPCKFAGDPIPDDLLAQTPSKPGEVPEAGKDFALCPQCDRNVKLTRLGYFTPHTTTLRGGVACTTAGVRAKHATDLALPGDELPKPGADRPKVSAQMEVEAAGVVPAPETPTAEDAAPASGDVSPPSTMHFPESTTTLPFSPTPSAEPSPNPTVTASEGPFPFAPMVSERFRQPDSPFLQPPEWAGTPKPEPMGDYARELATRIKETFYSYSNRKSVDNRSAQTTLGPSEIGTPCDRRLAMALMGIPAVNPGGDGWASFVGTCGHEGMAEIYRFADAGTGRYAVEFPVYLGVPSVPRGTADLLDRWTATISDWKFMGAYSLKKFKLEGPSDTYRVQAHVYAYGATCGGEKVKNVAIVGLPRAGSSLDEMHVWTERYDRKLAEAALDRVERIAEEVRQASLNPEATPMSVAREFPIDKDSCRYCPFHLKNDKEMIKGCPGTTS